MVIRRYSFPKSRDFATIEEAVAEWKANSGNPDVPTSIHWVEYEDDIHILAEGSINVDGGGFVEYWRDIMLRALNNC